MLIIKGTISPHTPLNAYFAVFVEGSLGQIFFNAFRSGKVASVLLSVSAGIYSAFQRIFVLTILFGFTLWESIDSFTNYVLATVFKFTNASFSLSRLLIGVYVLIHLAGAFYFGITANKLKLWIKDQAEFLSEDLGKLDLVERTSKKKKLKLRLATKSILLFILVLVLLSYFNPAWKANALTDVLIMSVRAIGITLLWYLLISPVTKKLLMKFTDKGKSKYWQDIDEMIKLFPQFNGALSYAKESTKEFKGIERVKEFLKLLLLISLVSEQKG